MNKKKKKKKENDTRWKYGSAQENEYGKYVSVFLHCLNTFRK